MFYIITPTGQVSLHVLEKCVFARLEYLRLLHEGKAHEFGDNFEYLLENSIYDRIGHFTLRLLSSVSEDLCNYWIVREILLFQTRLNYILPRHLFSKSSVFNHLVSKDHSKACNLFVTKVRYELVPDLIKRRKLDLNAGYAIVHCSKWKSILTSLFSTYITKELACIKSKAQYTINHDTRLDYLYHKIHCKIFQVNHVYGHITRENIDIEMKYFPPYGGMHLEDAVNYWKEEYSKPHSCSSVCLHNWQSNERKFIYSIRHLYGLEGSRKNYKSPTCNSICMNISSPMYEGGCPFKHFDMNTLKSLLCLSLSNDKVTGLLQTISSDNPQASCAEFFKMLNQDRNEIVISSPLQYYLTMIDQI
ncbi:DNA primase large subunit [Anthophora retusa]